MAADFKGGDRIRITTAWLTGCQPGDTATVEAIIPLGSGGAFYLVKTNPLCRGGTVICYGPEIRPVKPV
jgi:hypothetical protein